MINRNVILNIQKFLKTIEEESNGADVIWYIPESDTEAEEYIEVKCKKETTALVSMFLLYILEDENIELLDDILEELSENEYIDICSENPNIETLETLVDMLCMDITDNDDIEVNYAEETPEDINVRTFDHIFDEFLHYYTI